MLVRSGVIAGIAFVLLATGCGSTGHLPGPDATGTPPTDGATGSATHSGAVPPPAGRAALVITTQLGDQCPQIPVTPDARCDPKPRPYTAFKVSTAGGDLVADGRSDADGHGRVVVDPGTYVVRGEPVAGYQFTPQRQVVVSGSATVAVPLTYTNGIQ